jgi:hypothetical protein
MANSISRSIPPFPVRRPVGLSGRWEGEAPASPSSVWTIMRLSAGRVPRPPSRWIISVSIRKRNEGGNFVGVDSPVTFTSIRIRFFCGYGVGISRTIISQVTDRVLDEVRAWQNCPLVAGIRSRSHLKFRPTNAQTHTNDLGRSAYTAFLSANGGDLTLHAGLDSQYAGTGEGYLLVQGANLLAKDTLTLSGRAVDLPAATGELASHRLDRVDSFALGARCWDSLRSPNLCGLFREAGSDSPENLG